MNALVCTTPGHLEYRDQKKPELSRGKAILKIECIGICGTDLHAFEGTQPFFSYPRILGHELSATLLDIDGNTDFEKGEKVTFIPYFNCGTCIACRNGKPNCCVSMNVCGVHSDGGMVEFLSVPSKSLVHGDGLSTEALALIEPFAIGAHGIRRAEIKQGETVLVVGAGPIGLAIMEFARIAGARVIAMDVNDHRLEFCKKLDVKLTVNPSREDVLEMLKQLTGGEMPAAVIDATGNLNAIKNAFQYIAHGGRYVLVGLQKGEITFSHPEFHKREATLMSSRNATREDFEQVIAAINKGFIDPNRYITHRVSFNQARDQFPGWINPENAVIKAMIKV